MWTLGLGDHRLPGWPYRLIFGDLGLVAQSQSDVVETLHQAPTSVLINAERPVQLGSTHLLLDQVDGQLDARALLQEDPQLLDHLLLQDNRQQATLQGVVAK